MAEKKSKTSSIQGGFELKSVKFTKGGGVEAKFVHTVERDGSMNKIEKKVTNPIPRHPDLDKALHPLKLHVARIFGYLDLPKQGDEDVTDTMTITGVSFSGDEGSTTEGAVLSANKDVLGGARVVALNTPNVVLEADVYSHAKELEKHISAVRKEVEAYLFDEKYSQLTLFAGASEEPKKEEPTAASKKASAKAASKIDAAAGIPAGE